MTYGAKITAVCKCCGEELQKEVFGGERTLRSRDRKLKVIKHYLKKVFPKARILIEEQGW